MVLLVNATCIPKANNRIMEGSGETRNSQVPSADASLSGELPPSPSSLTNDQEVDSPASDPVAAASVAANAARAPQQEAVDDTPKASWSSRRGGSLLFATNDKYATAHDHDEEDGDFTGGLDLSSPDVLFEDQDELERESTGVALPSSPSRSSIVSTIGSYTTSVNQSSDSIEENDKGRIEVDPLVLFGSGNESRAMDDKSFRSELSKPDPPSIVDGVIPPVDDDNKDNGDVDSIETMGDEQHQSSLLAVLSEIGPKPPSEAPSLLGDCDDESDSDTALAEISRTVAEASLSEHDPPDPLKNLSPEPSGDLSDFMSKVLVENETPFGESVVLTNPANGIEESRTGTPLSNLLGTSSLPRETDDHFSALERKEALGADNLVVLPRVDEYRFYNQPPVQHATQAAFLAQQHLQMPPMQQQQQPQMQPIQYEQHPRSLVGYMPPVPGAMMIGGMSRRKIKLRLQEEVRTSNSDIRKHFRTTSLLGTLKKSSKRMLRFGSSTNPTVMESDNDRAMPALYKSVDHGSITVSWYEGTSSLELQQHVQKSVLRKLKLEKDNVELDDLRILDESSDPPEGN
jgi:hypothetical protein